MSRSEEFLQHHLAHEYDPEARRQYYLRTRKLKGRKKGGVDSATRARPTGSATPQAPRKAVQEASTARQVATQKAALEARLTKLKAVLKNLLDEAEKDGGESKRDKEASTSKDGGKKRAESSDLTAAEKRKKAAEARKDYKKEKKQPEPETKSLEEKISDVREQIAAIRAKLKAAIERAQAGAVVRSTSDQKQEMKRKE